MEKNIIIEKLIKLSGSIRDIEPMQSINIGAELNLLKYQMRRLIEIIIEKESLTGK